MKKEQNLIPDEIIGKAAVEKYGKREFYDNNGNDLSESERSCFTAGVSFALSETKDFYGKFANWIDDYCAMGWDGMWNSDNLTPSFKNKTTQELIDIYTPIYLKSKYGDDLGGLPGVESKEVDWDLVFPSALELKAFAIEEQRGLHCAVKDIEPFIRIANLVCKVFKEKMLTANGLMPTQQELRTFAIDRWQDWTGADDREVFCRIGTKVTEYIISKRNTLNK